MRGSDDLYLLRHVYFFTNIHWSINNENTTTIRAQRDRAHNVGLSGWRSGHQSRLPSLLQMLYVDRVFSRSQPDFEGFLRALRCLPSSKLTHSLFQFDHMQDLPENHFRVSGASWVNIINY